MPIFIFFISPRLYVNYTRDKKMLTEFGAHLVKIRKLKNIAQNELSYMVDVEVSQIYRIEKGLINPTLSTLINIAKALQISTAELLTF